MKLLDKIDNENIKKKIQEKDKLKLEFKRKLTDIMQKYGVDFDVTLLDNNTIDKIKFYNLKYKNIARDVSVIYDNKANYYSAFILSVDDNSKINNENYDSKKEYFDKTYKLPLMISEIKKVNDFYKNELDNIDKSFQKSNDTSIEMEIELKKINDPKNT